MAKPGPKPAAVPKPQAKKPKPPLIDPKPKASFEEQTSLQSKPSIEKGNTSFSSLLTSAMVSFYVGPKKKAYPIHRDLICSISPIFKAHFGSLETKNPVTDMYLPNHEPKIFEMFISFLYRGNFAEIIPRSQQESPNAEASATQDIHGSNLDLLISLYFIARDWALQDLQNYTLDHISRYVSKNSVILRCSHIATIYEKIKNPKSPLRRFAVDHFVFVVMRKGVAAKTRQTYLVNRAGIENMAFVWDVLEGLIAMRKYPVPVEPAAKGKCAYHEHPKGVQCPE
ncbi:MAG: hypothetical protein Q9225_006171 [Loekoesia sp. 1 TL-2023]